MPRLVRDRDRVAGEQGYLIGFIFASLTILPQFFVSTRINAANSSGVPVIGKKLTRKRDQVRLPGTEYLLGIMSFGN